MIKLTMEVVRKRAGKKATVGIVEAKAPVLALSSKGYGGHTLLIEIASESHSARKAYFAHLMKRRQATSSDSPDRTDIEWSTGYKSEGLYLAAKTRYISVEKDDRFIIMHPGFLKDTRKYFVGGDFDTPSEFFAESLRINTNIPFTDKYIPALWKIALREGALKSAESFGDVQVWKVDDDIHDKLVPHLKEVIAYG